MFHSLFSGVLSTFASEFCDVSLEKTSSRHKSNT